MRLKRNRLVELKHCPLEQKKDNEGGTYIEYGSAVPFRAEMWQYTCTGRVPGIQGDVDIDVYMPDPTKIQ